MRVYDSDKAVIKSFKANVATDLRERFCGDDVPVTNASMIASALDPRFRSLPHLNDEQRAEVYQKIRREVEPLKELREPAKKKAKPTPSALDFLLSPPTEDNEDEEDNEEEEKDEFDSYLSGQDCKTTTDVMKWWSEHMSQFPAVGKLAMRYACIPATSVPSECVFSAAVNIVNSKRSSLTPEHVNMLVFLSKLTKNGEPEKKKKKKKAQEDEDVVSDDDSDSDSDSE